jgi:hypothetical protein
MIPKLFVNKFSKMERTEEETGLADRNLVQF